MGAAAADDFTVGEDVTATITFAVAGVPTDPTDQTATVETPAGVLTHPTLDRVSDGVFTLVQALTGPGLWRFRVVGTGAAAAAVEGTVYARPSVIV